jgi:hypothetical protein
VDSGNLSLPHFIPPAHAKPGLIRIDEKFARSSISLLDWQFGGTAAALVREMI